MTPPDDDPNTRLEYTLHARQRMRERRIQPEEVVLTLAAPDNVTYGEDGELIAIKPIGRRQISVVFVESEDVTRIITVIADQQ